MDQQAKHIDQVILLTFLEFAVKHPNKLIETRPKTYFLLRTILEKRLQVLYPGLIPTYDVVTFSLIENIFDWLTESYIVLCLIWLV